MRYLHKNNIFNLDLKLEIILIDENYYPHINAFNLSRFFPKILSNSNENKMNSQLDDRLCMAPEILSGKKEFIPAVDVYAFGIVANEIVTGKRVNYEIGETKNTNEEVFRPRLFESNRILQKSS
ncbi:hypothetical protein M9Y10_014597 [Tritrichomonas musculus]|uniref:Protein kinase domain-containing protein n=1 Tax=Tritrichomonas musculus TaxID=1915356 RepID=A0ABR2L052_9EUKA